MKGNKKFTSERGEVTFSDSGLSRGTFVLHAFDRNTLVEYHVSYFSIEALISASRFEAFYKLCYETYGLEQSNFIQNPILKVTGIFIRPAGVPKMFLRNHNPSEKQKIGFSINANNCMKKSCKTSKWFVLNKERGKRFASDSKIARWILHFSSNGIDLQYPDPLHNIDTKFPLALSEGAKDFFTGWGILGINMLERTSTKKVSTKNKKLMGTLYEKTFHTFFTFILWQWSYTVVWDW